MPRTLDREAQVFHARRLLPREAVDLALAEDLAAFLVTLGAPRDIAPPFEDVA